MEFLNRKNILKILLVNLLVLNTAWGTTPLRFSVFEGTNCTPQKDFQFLSSDEKKSLEKKNNLELNSKIIRRYKVKCGKKESFAYVFNDRVRTHYQTLLIWRENNSLKAIEVLNFNEPKEYKAPKKWLERFHGKKLDDLYQVDALSGATLTRQSTLKLAKKALVIE